MRRNLRRCTRDERIRAPRLGRVQRRREANAHEHGHQRHTRFPPRARGEIEDQRVRDQVRGAITELVCGGHEAELLGAARAFDAPRVDRDVLRRGGESHDDRERAEHDQACLRPERTIIATRPAMTPNCASTIQLRRLPSRPSTGSSNAVEQRRPDELQRIRETDPRDEADRRELGAFVAQPCAERVARQQERQAGRKTERDHREHARLAERRQDVAPAVLRARLRAPKMRQRLLGPCRDRVGSVRSCARSFACARCTSTAGQS